MKRFLVRSLSFVVVSVFVYLVLLFLAGSSGISFLQENLKFKIGSYGHMHTRLRDADTTSNVDILFLGSSHSYRSYDPRIFQKAGIRIFNLGSSAQTPLQTELLVDRYLETMSPKLVVFDVFPALLMNQGVESSLDLIANGKIDKDVINLAFQVNNFTVYNTLIYGLSRQALRLDDGFQEAISRKGDTYIRGGYVETYRKFIPKDSITPTTIKPDEVQVAAMDRVIQKLKACRIPYLLVQSPMATSQYNSFINNEAMDRFYDRRGTYYNFNKILQLPDSMFFDPGHLNQAGVDVYSSAMIRLLKPLVHQ